MRHSISDSITRGLCRCGRRNSSRPGREWPISGLIPGSSGCGNTTWPIAKAASARAASTWPSSASRALEVSSDGAPDAARLSALFRFGDGGRSLAAPANVVDYGPVIGAEAQLHPAAVPVVPDLAIEIAGI